MLVVDNIAIRQRSVPASSVVRGLSGSLSLDFPASRHCSLSHAWSIACACEWVAFDHITVPCMCLEDILSVAPWFSVTC